MYFQEHTDGTFNLSTDDMYLNGIYTRCNWNDKVGILLMYVDEVLVIFSADCHFRFEYPPAPTPKKRSSTGGKTETLKVTH